MGRLPPLGDIGKATTRWISNGLRGNLQTVTVMQQLAHQAAGDPLIQGLAKTIVLQAGVPSHYYIDEAVAIGQFVQAHVRYSRDPDGYEQLQTPERLVSQISAGRKASLTFEVNGSEGSLGWDSESPNSLWVGHRKQANEELLKDPSLMTPAARPYSAYPGGHTEGYPDTFVQLFKDFYAYIEKGGDSRPEFPTFQAGHDELVLCEAIAQSARKGGWVKIGKD